VIKAKKVLIIAGVIILLAVPGAIPIILGTKIYQKIRAKKTEDVKVI
jgi:hypothetical protein